MNEGKVAHYSLVPRADGSKWVGLEGSDAICMRLQEGPRLIRCRILLTAVLCLSFWWGDGRKATIVSGVAFQGTLSV